MLRDRGDPLGIWNTGAPQVVGDRGVWVPDGMDGNAILAGAAVLRNEFDIGEYTARSIAIDVWRAMADATPKSDPS